MNQKNPKRGLKKFTLISLELNWPLPTQTAFYSVSNLKTSMKILRKLKIFGTSPPYQKTTNTTMPRLRISWGCLNWRLVLIRYLLVLVWFFLYTKSKIIKVKTNIVHFHSLPSKSLQCEHDTVGELEEIRNR